MRSSSRRSRNNHPFLNRRNYDPKPLGNNILNPEIPKGHTVVSIEYAFEALGFVAKIKVPVSGGTKKSLNKKVISTGGYLSSYVIGMNKEDLIRFGQFQIEDIPKKQEEAKPSTKGEYGGVCNRTACTTKIPALYYNHSTKMHYCSKCAEMINDVNRADAIRLYGHDLCTLVVPQEQVK